MLKTASLYTALLFAANAAAADPALQELATGEMAALRFHQEPREVPDIMIDALEGEGARLTDFAGEPVVLNFWATWCAPCREEMPSLDRLQAEMGDRIEVVTVATGRNSPQGIRRFFEEEGIELLPMLVDPRQELARGMAVLGLPVTVILDAEGQEVARLTGGAEWDAPEAMAILDRLAGDATSAAEAPAN